MSKFAMSIPGVVDSVVDTATNFSNNFFRFTENGFDTLCMMLPFFP